MRKNKSKNSNTQKIIYSLLFLFILFISTFFINNVDHKSNNIQNNNTIDVSTYSNLKEIPEYSGEIYVKLNDNKPYFSEEDYTTKAFENYSELDSLGRCGIAYANICKEIMPPEENDRGSISSVKPSGWKQVKVDGEYLYNRCHLIAYSLSDENANKLNLITGTRFFNVQGMLPFERTVLEYINKNENNHVLYRVTPVFFEENLLATGVEIEACSVEDNGEGLSFNVFVYNIQPGVNIDYSTGSLLN